MKNLFLMIAVVAMFSLNACAQKNKDVPEKVKTSFNQKFPNAQKVKWDKENETEWEAEFKMNGEEYSANFNSDGTWMETEYEIEESAIPKAVQETLSTVYKGYDIEDVEVSETADGKVYEFGLEKDETDLEVAIAPSGKVVKKEVKEEEEQEEDND